MVSGYGIALTFGLVDNFSDKLKKANAAVAQTGKSVSRANKDMRQFQQNLVFAAEDAMAVYGTTGLSGVLRATSNNITMMAMALAPGSALASGLTVAAMGVGQIALAWWTAGEEARKAEEKQKKAAAAARTTDLLKDQIAAIKEEGRFRYSLREKDKEQIQELIDAEKENLAINQEARAVADQSHKQAREQLEMRRKAQRELDLGRSQVDPRLPQEYATAVREARARESINLGILAGLESEEVLKERIAKHDEIIKDLAKEREQAENRIAIATEAQATAAAATAKETERIARNVRSSVDGSKKFAEAFMGTKAGGKGLGTKDVASPRKSRFSERGMRPRDELEAAWGVSRERRTRDELEAAWGVSREQRPRNEQEEFFDAFGVGQQKDAQLEQEIREWTLKRAWGLYHMDQLQASSSRMSIAGFGRDPVSQGLADEGIQSFEDFMRINGIPETPEKAAELRRYQMKRREKSPEYYKTMDSAMRKRAELEKKRQATKEEMETAANTKRSSELLSQIAEGLNRGPTIEVSVGGVLT
jgi:hypothetical protein